ncbi:hypothetical protein C8Q80DRAFT_1097241 [Daedaleopsis nitida]|nr:hypothetical protein C8Q80DRAFT_1097241 [Daedaleopsis nitida]
MVALAAAALLYLWLRVRIRFTTRKGVGEGEGAHSAVYLSRPDPLVDFDLETATARNFVYANKTVRYPYYQTMSHQPMHVNHWIEIDKEYKWYLSEKQRIIAERGKVVVDSLPENDEACGELLMSLVDYLPKRYPTLFRREGHDTIVNMVMGETHVDLSSIKGVDALHVVSRLVQDDFLMAMEREDGHVYCVGGIVAFPGFYLLSEKIDQPIQVMHEPVPHFNEKLLTSVERTLRRFRPDQPFERSGWMFTTDRNLFWHDIVTDKTVDPNIHPKDYWLRVDHQTFVKLPKTNGIMFGVHPIMHKLEDLADSPLVPALLEKVTKDSDVALMEYKCTRKCEAQVLPYLRELTQRQIDRGLITHEDDVRSFRELLKDKPMEVPSKQSTLSVPTESEVKIAMQAASTTRTTKA